MLESTQQIKKIDLDYFVINHQWQNTTSQTWPTRIVPANPITDH